MSAENLIREAQRKHIENPVDAAHDFFHHLAVASNMLEIVRNENLGEEVNIDTLMIVAWWHDYKRDDLEGCLADVNRFCEESGIEESERELITGAIRGHSLENEVERGVDVYSKLLFDGDKIEYYSCKRYLRALESVRSGEMSQEQFQAYKEKAMRSVIEAYNQLNYGAARDMFVDNLRRLRDCAQNEPEYIDVAEFMDSDHDVQRLLGER